MNSPKLTAIKLRPQHRKQEFWNGITHGISAICGIGALGPLIILAVLKGNMRHVVSFSIFGGALVFLFVASTVMHFHRSTGAVKAIYGFLDHLGICLVIAGTYTPLCLITLHGPLGYALLTAVWGLALGGILLSFIYGERFMQYGNYVYMAMGWLIMVAIKPLWIGLTPLGMAIFFLGGLVYSAGVVFLAAKKVYHYHAIWHLFVTLGAILHLIVMIFFVLPDMH